MNSAMGWAGNLQTTGGNEEDQVNAEDPLSISKSPQWTTIPACVEVKEYLNICMWISLSELWCKDVSNEIEFRSGGIRMSLKEPSM